MAASHSGASTNQGAAQREQLSDPFGRAVLIAVCSALAAIALSALYAHFAKSFFSGLFPSTEDTEAKLEPYLAFIDNRMAWRMGVIIVVGTALRLSVRRFRLGSWSAWFGASALSSLLLSNWYQYQILVVCGTALLCVRPKHGLLLFVPMTFLVAGFITDGFSNVPFTSVEIDKQRWHSIAASQVGFWMLAMVAISAVTSMFERAYAAKEPTISDDLLRPRDVDLTENSNQPKHESRGVPVAESTRSPKDEAMRPCPKCNKEINQKATTCMHCWAKIAPAA